MIYKYSIFWLYSKRKRSWIYSGALIRCLRQRRFVASDVDHGRAFLSDTTSRGSAKSFRKVTKEAIQNRRRRYGSDPSESGHTQYAFPKKGNAVL